MYFSPFSLPILLKSSLRLTEILKAASWLSPLLQSCTFQYILQAPTGGIPLQHSSWMLKAFPLPLTQHRNRPRSSCLSAVPPGLILCSSAHSAYYAPVLFCKTCHAHTVSWAFPQALSSSRTPASSSHQHILYFLTLLLTVFKNHFLWRGNFPLGPLPPTPHSPRRKCTLTPCAYYMLFCWWAHSLSSLTSVKSIWQGQVRLAYGYVTST